MENSWWPYDKNWVTVAQPAVLISARQPCIRTDWKTQLSVSASLTRNTGIRATEKLVSERQENWSQSCKQTGLRATGKLVTEL